MLNRVLTVLTAVALLSIIILYIIVIPSVKGNQVKGDDKVEFVSKEQNKQNEIVRIQDNKLIYQGFKLDSLKKTYGDFLVKYKTKMDSIDLAFEQLQFSMERMDDRLTQKDKKLEEDILSVTELFESFKRKTNRDLRQVKNDIKSISSDIEDLVFFTKRIPDKYLLDEEEVREQEAKNNQ